MVKKNRRFYIIIALIFLLAFIVISPLRGDFIQIGALYGFNLSSLIGYFLYFILACIFLFKYGKTRKPSNIFIAMLIGASLVELPIRIIDFHATLFTLPDFLIHIFGVATGYLAFISRQVFRYVLLIVCFPVAIWLSIEGNDMWRQNWNFHTFTGRIEDSKTYNSLLYTSQGDSVFLREYKNRYVLLDFWFTHCGVCYKKFPEVQKLYDKYKDDTRIALFAVHNFSTDTIMILDHETIKKIPQSVMDSLIRCHRIILGSGSNNAPSVFTMDLLVQYKRFESHATGADILKKRRYSFPCLSAPDTAHVFEDLGIESYPTVLIFDKDSKLIFRGDIKYAAKLIDELMEKEK
jgi:thiol-disulfide isomerase/thioredoxin